MFQQLRISRLSNVMPVGMRAGWFPLVRYSLGAILLIAAGLKSGSDPLMAHAIMGVPNVVLVFGELAFAAWLFSARQPAFSWWACIACFASFAIFAGYKVINGDSDCGCFGAVSPPPWAALAIDLAVLSVLCAVGKPRSSPVSVPCGAGFQPARLTENNPHSVYGRQGESPPHAKSNDAALFGVVRSTAYVIVLLLTAKVALMSLSQHEIGHETLIAKPSEWLGSKFPLLNTTDLADQLVSGEWLVVLHRPGCSTCDELLTKLAAVPASNSGRETLRLAIIELSGNSPDVHRHLQISALHGRVTDRAAPLLPAPLLITLHDGEVMSVAEGDQSLRALDEILSGERKSARATVENVLAAFSGGRGAILNSMRRPEREQEIAAR